MKRPGEGHYATTPAAEMCIRLLGAGISDESIALSGAEIRALRKLYGYVPEKSRKRPPPPEPPPAGVRLSMREEIEYKDKVRAHEAWSDPRAFMQVAADRNALRHAKADGLRMAAWIAKFVPQGADPLKALVQLAADAGWDVDPEDAAWAGEPEDVAAPGLEGEA